MKLQSEEKITFQELQDMKSLKEVRKSGEPIVGNYYHINESVKQQLIDGYNATPKLVNAFVLCYTSYGVDDGVSNVSMEIVRLSIES